VATRQSAGFGDASSRTLKERLVGVAPEIDVCGSFGYAKRTVPRDGRYDALRQGTMVSPSEAPRALRFRDDGYRARGRQVDA